MKYQANAEFVELKSCHRPKNILIKQRGTTRYVVPLTGPIGEIHEYGDFVSILAQAREEDQVYIQLSSYGGSLETCDYLCRRMDECEAPITVEIGMTCASVASAIALQADNWVIHDSSSMIIHSTHYSPGYGKECDVRARTEHMQRVNREWIERTYDGFLYEEELYDVLVNGTELYFFADDLRERTPQFKEYREQCNARRFEEIVRSWESQQ